MSAPNDELSKKESTHAPAASPSASPPTSPAVAEPRSPSLDYYASRPKFDRLGNPIINRTAMSAHGGSGKIRLPGDLGAKDPRRPKSPALSTLPGDLGPNDPRRPRSMNSSPAPSSGHKRNASYESSEAGAGRLEEDPPRPEDEQQGSDEDADADNDNDTDRDDEGKRGRGRKRPEPGRTTSGKAVGLRDESVDSEADMIKPDPTKGESKLSFARDPRLKVSSPGGKKRVHPSTAFDVAPSGPSTPLGSDDESHSELRAAQKLSLTTSAVHSTPSAHRVIRQIIRGDYSHFQREAEEGRRRQRMYLVSTDLSPESEYALEWTIGTVLRDGDTLFAVYASDLETVAGSEKGEGVEIGHGAESVEDTAATLRALPATTIPPPSPSPLAKSAAVFGSSETRSRSRGVYSAAETERRRAIEEITAKCIMLLRKTRLQVRVVVEVFHCKSPRHMITEVIDFLSPTLVVIGSRGRSAVKGVLLGSFSNYLVTKSSVPVMVARKKLRKHSKSVKRNPDGTVVPYSGSGRTGRFSNVIEAPRGKGLRVQGWDKVGID
ncbi:adenine nucleotide alpha hydrolases-like protein [Teratosphaeria destructans]|uniref:Adenine nucleotide alpha hydrolases-like protein n=1 Tax=Teratosphaeria destructans TaxID=418781 RepID=A0A9W7SK32_9PEZI|nr:adenine nucleotide alpha hydrolases-like protein [Teratosphaeria destructans]